MYIHIYIYIYIERERLYTYIHVCLDVPDQEGVRLPALPARPEDEGGREGRAKARHHLEHPGERDGEITPVFDGVQLQPVHDGVDHHHRAVDRPREGGCAAEVVAAGPDVGGLERAICIYIYIYIYIYICMYIYTHSLTHSHVPNSPEWAA